MAANKHLLVIRLSSLGDVAMTVPVLHLLLEQNTDLQITVLSASFCKPLFKGHDRLHFIGANLKKEHKGVPGLYRLYKEVSATATFTGLADLHDVLRSKILRSFFKFRRMPKAVINKGRKEKAELTRPANKILRPLRSNFERYADVFRKLGYRIELKPIFLPRPPAHELIVKAWQSGRKTIGIAPFAQFDEKTYPLQKMKEVIRLLNGQKVTVFLFGGSADAPELSTLEASFNNVVSVAGKMPLDDELSIIASLDVMLSMDSANMHLASLYGVPVVSVWGGTHPWLGFYGWQQQPQDAVQIDLECRPSSVFGNKPCPRGDKECMHGINPITIVEKLLRHIEIEK